MRALIFVSILAACGGKSNGDDTPDADPTPDAQPAPVFRNPVDLPDDVLAVKALELLGANIENARPNSCNDCHGMTRQHLNYWRALSDSAMTDCFTDLAVGSQESAKAMMECLRMVPDGESDFDATKAGIYATAIDLPWFKFTIEKAYGADAPTRLTQLEAKVGMPRGTEIPQFTQAEFDIVAEWFARGLPTLDSTLTSDPAPTVCLPGITGAVNSHVTAMATSGWRAVNKTNLMAMHNCGASTDPKDCFANKPFAADQSFGTGWDVAGMGKTRLLATLPYRTSFWTRSSPDGRFVGAGAISNASLGIGQEQSVIYDLQRDATVIIDALYDPAFFPDNSGFVFQGGARNTCGMSVLTSNPTHISMTETACKRIATIGLYQHVGQALDGGDYFTIDSEFVSDDGANQQAPTLRDPLAHFPDNSAMYLNPLVFNGTSYTGKPQVKIDVPFEGDSVLSPSAKLIISRVANAQERQLGYVMRRVDATPSGSSYDITTPEIARYCMSGGKPSFSFDERWIVYHHYVTSADAVELGFTGPNDPAFAPYLSQGAANVYLMELTTGAIKRVTNMKPGQYALFPHFRSDGWIYIQIRDRSDGNQEYVLASDAALLAE
jgi:hypothetical protein